jgi:hypothetical protein
MTAADREKCRQIAEALDSGDLDVARREREFLGADPARPGLVWDLRAAQRKKRRKGASDDGSVVCPTCGGSGRVRPADDDDEDENDKEARREFEDDD